MIKLFFALHVGFTMSLLPLETIEEVSAEALDISNAHHMPEPQKDSIKAHDFGLCCDARGLM